MNILFIGPYRQNDGWGLAAQDYISCLQYIKEHTISCVPIYMSNNIDQNPKSNIMEAENTYCNKFDVIIQNVLPNYFEKHEGYNIGIYYSETKDLNSSLFIEKINLMDELWVSSESEKQTLKQSGIEVTIEVIPIPLNTECINNHIDIAPLDIPGPNDYFNFYMLAEHNERKNIEAAIIAFNREFSNNEKVNLILKTTINGIPDQQANQKITEDILAIKNRLRLFNRPDLYRNEILISSSLKFDQIMSLHKTGDCLLVPSRGEAYCRPALEALCFSNKVICTDNIHTCSILKEHCITADSMRVPVVINGPPAPHIYTGWETWDEISILDLQTKMREVMSDNSKESLNSPQWVVDNFSYASIAKKIRGRLCQL